MAWLVPNRISQGYRNKVDYTSSWRPGHQKVVVVGWRENPLLTFAYYLFYKYSPPWPPGYLCCDGQAQQCQQSPYSQVSQTKVHSEWTIEFIRSWVTLKQHKGRSAPSINNDVLVAVQMGGPFFPSFSFLHPPPSAFSPIHSSPSGDLEVTCSSGRLAGY